jgi:lipoprotein-releasing system ATP-binding protein
MTVNRVLEAKSISKYFYNASTTQVLDQVSVQVNRGEFVTIMGKSGCGKSTLLYILSTMDTDCKYPVFRTTYKLEFKDGY